MTNSNYLVTGVAGFIGFHLAIRLLLEGQEVIGVDNVNDYYEVSLKEARLAQLCCYDNFSFYKISLEDTENIEQIFARHTPQVVIHLAAQPGVRYSLQNPHAYINSNVVGFLNVLEGCRYGNVRHLVFASSSSVYGANTKMPFCVDDNVDHPVSLYAATKKANELMAHTYSHLYKIPATGLRFFTVYGPWGRPDMAVSLFTKAILAGKPIKVFNFGKMQRDFTYVDDIVEGVVRVIDNIPSPDACWRSDSPTASSSNAPYRIYNIGNNRPVALLKLIETIEDCLGVKAEKQLLPLQPGDVVATYADIDELARDVGFSPNTPIEVGIERFVSWYRGYYLSETARK